MCKLCLYVFMFLCWPIVVYAQQPDTGFVSIQLENDIWGSNDDRFYTHGAEVSFASDQAPPSFLEKASDLIPFYRKGELGIHGYSIGQKIFTPEDLNQTQLIEDDRPYAGWLFYNTGIAHVFEDKGDTEQINGLILTIGIVGPSSLGENVQKELHRWFTGDQPMGWDNQLKDELGLGITYLRKWRQLHNFDEPRHFEISYHSGLTLGNVYTYPSIGLMMRWGTHLKDDVGPPSISPGFPGIPAFNPNRQSNWYVFAGLETRAMLRNIFLDGNTFKDSHSVDKETLVTDLQLGVALHFDDMRLSFTQLLRSKEFEGQPEAAQYGAINLTILTH